MPPKPSWTGYAGRWSASPARIVLPFLPPAIQGLGKFGGFTFELRGPGRPHPGRTGQRDRAR